MVNKVLMFNFDELLDKTNCFLTMREMRWTDGFKWPIL